MKKHDSLSKKLQSYSTLAAVMVAAASGADAQIVYTDVSPDSVCTEHNIGYSIDLNVDTTFDFSLAPLKYGSGNSFSNKIVGVGSNSIYSVVASTKSNYVYPLALNEGEVIGPDLSWHTYSSYLWVLAKSYSSGAGAVQAGNWLGKTDKFLGLRIEVDGEKFYGWARLDVDSSASQFTIKSFAYQSIADSSIKAGDTTKLNIGVPSLPIQNLIRIFSYGSNIFIYGEPSGNELIIIRVYDLLGTTVKGISTAEYHTTLNLSDLPKGIYFVSVKQGDLLKTRKVSIK